MNIDRGTIFKWSWSWLHHLPQDCGK